MNTCNRTASRFLNEQNQGGGLNMRLKLTAPSCRGRIAFVTTVRMRRSLGAVR